MVKCIIFVSILIVFDIVTGILAALKDGNFSSSRMRKGLLTKTSELITIILMCVMEIGLPEIGINVSIPFVGVSAAYIIVMEVGSIFENLAKMNPTLAGLLENIFAQVKRIEEVKDGGIIEDQKTDRSSEE